MQLPVHSLQLQGNTNQPMLGQIISAWLNGTGNTIRHRLARRTFQINYDHTTYLLVKRMFQPARFTGLEIIESPNRHDQVP